MPSLTQKIINGKPYYYLRECQRVNGKPKIIWTFYIGSAQNLLDKISRPEPLKVCIREFGASVASFDIAQSLNVVDIIDRHVPKQGSQGPSVGQYLLAATLNRCVSPTSKAQLGEWYDKTVLRRLMPLSSAQLISQRFWENMDRVTEKQLSQIEQEIASKCVSEFKLKLNMLLFDCTNFFTYVDSFNDKPQLPQRGHSKEGRANLRIVGLALMVTSDGDVPLFHNTYAGNQHDSITFSSVINQLAQRCRQLSQDVEEITLNFDKGNNSDENLEAVEKGPWHFVGSLVPTHHPDLLKIKRKEMRRLDTKKLSAVWSTRIQKKIFDVERTVLVTWNQPLYDAQLKTLQREIRKRQIKLEEIQKRLKKTSKGKKPTVEGTQKQVQGILSIRHMKDLFRAKVRLVNNRPRLSFYFQEKKWEMLKTNLLGKTILFTDRTEWSDEEIVLAYRAQHHVESSFRRMKDPRFLTFRPTFHWTDQKLRVHAFTCVLALMIVSLMRRKASHAGYPMSCVQLLDKLSDIQEVDLVYASPEKIRKLSVCTVLSETDDRQRDLMKVLGLSRYLVETKN